MLIEAAKGGHTNVVSYLLDYPNNILSVPAPDLSQLTPPSHDTSQVSGNVHSLTVISNYPLLNLLDALNYENTNLWSACNTNVLYNSLHCYLIVLILFDIQAPRVPFQALAMVVPPQEPDRVPSTIPTPPPVTSKG